MNPGPALEALTRRLAECPAEFLDEPRLGNKGRIVTAAVVNDLLLALGGQPLTKDQRQPFDAKNDRMARNRLRLTLVTSWLLYDLWFQQQANLAPLALPLLTDSLTEAANLTPANQFITDPDRREELVRLALKGLNLIPAGETEAQAQDRLATLNSAERQRVIQAARAAEERAQQIREAMAKKAAEEAADKAGRE
jgi:hypothetical protein